MHKNPTIFLSYVIFVTKFKKLYENPLTIGCQFDILWKPHGKRTSLGVGEYMKSLRKSMKKVKKLLKKGLTKAKE